MVSQTTFTVTQRDTLADRVADLIADLGDTPDAIAYHLAKAGISGRRADATCCPIANYLLRAEPSFDLVDVYGEVIDVSTRTGHTTSLPAPAAINEFVKVFDFENGYPDLISHAEVTR